MPNLSLYFSSIFNKIFFSIKPLNALDIELSDKFVPTFISLRSEPLTFTTFKKVICVNIKIRLCLSIFEIALLDK